MKHYLKRRGADVRPRSSLRRHEVLAVKARRERPRVHRHLWVRYEHGFSDGGWFCVADVTLRGRCGKRVTDMQVMAAGRDGLYDLFMPVVPEQLNGPREVVPVRRRKPSAEDRTLPLFTNEEKPRWPVVHQGALLSSTSDETGGPLNAREAERVTRGASIRFAGHLYDDGLLHCRACTDLDGPFLTGHGFRMSVYKGMPRDRFVGKCGKCGVAVVGEPPR